MFQLFKYICHTRKLERNSRQKAKEYCDHKVLKKYWGAWFIFKLQESKSRLDNNLADHYRIQKLQRQLFMDLKMSNQIFNKVYSDEKMDNIYKEKLYMRSLTSLLLFKVRENQKMRSLPDQPAFYHIADLWLQGYSLSTLPGAKYKKLQVNFHQKLNIGYKMKAMYSLIQNYKMLQAFKINVALKKIENVFSALKRYTTK